MFYGKQSKPIPGCYFCNLAQREKSIAIAFESRRQHLAAKAKQAAERKAAPALTFAVGDILSTCWGYDQTNREFYQVTKVRGLAVTVRQIVAETVATGDMTARVIPLPGRFVGPELNRRARPWAAGLKISSCQRANPHDFEVAAGMKVYRAVSVSSYA